MPDERKNIKTYRKKERMILSRFIRRRRRCIEVTLGNNDGVRLLLLKEKGMLFDGNKAYLPAENFVLEEFFDRYVNLVFIDYSKVTDTTDKPEKEKITRPKLPAGFLEKLKQIRYNNHMVRVYTTYIGDLSPFDISTNERTMYLTGSSFQQYISYRTHEYYDGTTAEVLDFAKSPVLEYSVPCQREDVTYVDGRFYCCSDNIEFSQKVSKFFGKLKKEFRYVKRWKCYISNSIDVEASRFFIPNRIITINKEDLK